MVKLIVTGCCGKVPIVSEKGLTKCMVIETGRTYYRKDHPIPSVQTALLQDYSVCLFLCIQVTKEAITNTEGWREN